MRTLIQVQSIPPRVPPQPVEWFGPMPPIGSEMTIVGVKHEVVKYSYDVDYDISVDQAMPQSGSAIDPPHYGYMRCTQLTIHLKPKHREPEGDLIASLIGEGSTGFRLHKEMLDFVENRRSTAAQRQAADVERTGIPK